jgi:cyclophilin family peptidyl-prolyl cis-trans isomerase
VGTDKRQRQKANRAKARNERIRRQKMNKVRRRGLIFGVGIPAVIAALFLIANAVGGGNDSSSDEFDAIITTTIPASGIEGRTITGKTPCPKTDGTEERATQFEQAPELCIDPAKSYTAVFETTEGTIEVALDTKNTPNTVNNFVTLARYKYYDTTTIFRTDPSIDIIQGGGMNPTASAGYTIKDEGTGFEYETGDLVMARSSGSDSGGSQFFFVTGEKAALLNSQGTYVTFGKISKGLDVAQGIMALHTPTGELGGEPSRQVVVTSVTIIEK